jgi:hypothetical protein
MNYYINLVNEIDSTVNARHLLGFMLLKHDILSRLPLSTFRKEIGIFKAGFRPCDEKMWESNAKSFGL